jgi:ArsR family transcriptional regulator
LAQEIRLHIRYIEYTVVLLSTAPRPQTDLGLLVQEALRRFKADIFQALANPTRIAIVELLRDEKVVPVSRICERLELEQANISQHLAVLRSKHIVSGQKKANQVFYSLRDPIIGRILNLMKQYFQSHLNQSLEVLKSMESAMNPPK